MRIASLYVQRFKTSFSLCQHVVFKHPRRRHLIFPQNIHSLFISVYEVVAFKLNQQEVYFQLFSTIVNYVQKMELVKSICL
jgi:hypothetical protein